MGNAQHIIELNGKRYDAVTGKMIASPAAAPAAPTTSHAQVPRKHRNVDGFTQPLKPAGRINSAAGRKTEKSKTLMRKTVSRPTPKKPEAAVVVSPSEVRHIKTATLVSPSKLIKAKAVPKSSLVKRFSEITATKPAAYTAAEDQPPTPQTVRLHAIASSEAVATNPLADGLFKASSHEQESPKKLNRHARIAHRLHISPRVLSGGALALAGLLIAGFFTYQNVPNLKMRVASARSGVHGSLPGYQPAGFNLNGAISYKPGQIIVSYKSASDNRNFQITQAVSSWNSDTLRDTYVAANHPNYQMVNPKGKTVYLYDSSATWVDGGIWYRVEGDSQLNSDQLQNIANSL